MFPQTFSDIYNEVFFIIFPPNKILNNLFVADFTVKAFILLTITSFSLTKHPFLIKPKEVKLSFSRLVTIERLLVNFS